MDQYISPEEHAAQQVNENAKPKKLNPVFVVLGAIVLLALSFFGGTRYEKAHVTNATTTTASTGQPGSRGSFGGGGPGGFSNGDRVIGTVSSASSTSISVKDARSGSTTTLSISSSTKITDNGSTVTASDIQAGDTVLVSKSSSSSTTATTIMVNPSFGGQGGGQASGGSSTVQNQGSQSTGSATVE
jgi:hypothetical protein